MTSVSGIASWGSLVQGNLSQTLATPQTSITTNTSTPAIPGSGVSSLVDLFLENPHPVANGTTDNLSTSDLYLGMLKLPVVPLNNGDDDDI